MVQRSCEEGSAAVAGMMWAGIRIEGKLVARTCPLERGGSDRRTMQGEGERERERESNRERGGEGECERDSE